MGSGKMVDFIGLVVHQIQSSDASSTASAYTLRLARDVGKRASRSRWGLDIPRETVNWFWVDPERIYLTALFLVVSKYPRSLYTIRKNQNSPDTCGSSVVPFIAVNRP
jgi:hypothetical protein